MTRAKAFQVAACLFSSVAAWQCAAGGDPSSASVQTEAEPGSAPVLPDAPPGTPSGGGNDDGFLLGETGDAVDANGNPLNIGSELACDGVDENQNEIIDDVDKGKDGLCDCLRIGFLGDFASDAGNQTGAFETWLEERSDVPVAHIRAQDPLTAEALASLQVLVIGNMAQRASSGGYSAAEVQVLADWVQQGGGVMSLAGYTARESDITPTVALLAPLGVSYDYQGRGPGVLGMGAPPVIVRGIADPTHPTMDGIRALGVYNAYPVTGDGTVIVQDAGLVLAMAKTVGSGRVFAFSDEWITQDLLWSPMQNRPLTPCQQGCNQCAMQCAACDRQCSDCQLQPCQGGQIVPDGGTCARGCDQGCSSCSTSCDSCEQICATCSAQEVNDTLDIPRFWLNVLRWLTPANECQVPIPPTVVF